MTIQQIPDTGEWGDIAELINSNFQMTAPTAYGDFSMTTPVLLTNADTAVINWNQSAVVDPVAISVTDSKFYCSELGILAFNLERIYKNDDNNPTSVVNLTIKIAKNGDLTPANLLFEATLPISSATANDEPAIASFNTPFLVPVTTATDYYEVYVSAEDSGATPQDVSLIRMKVVANMIHRLPTAPTVMRAVY